MNFNKLATTFLLAMSMALIVHTYNAEEIHEGLVLTEEQKETIPTPNFDYSFSKKVTSFIKGSFSKFYK